MRTILALVAATAATAAAGDAGGDRDNHRVRAAWKAKLQSRFASLRPSDWVDVGFNLSRFVSPWESCVLEESRLHHAGLVREQLRASATGRWRQLDGENVTRTLGHLCTERLLSVRRSSNAFSRADAEAASCSITRSQSAGRPCPAWPSLGLHARRGLRQRHAALAAQSPERHFAAALGEALMGRLQRRLGVVVFGDSVSVRTLQLAVEGVRL